MQRIPLDGLAPVGHAFAPGNAPSFWEKAGERYLEAMLAGDLFFVAAALLLAVSLAIVARQRVTRTRRRRDAALVAAALERAGLDPFERRRARRGARREARRPLDIAA